MEHTAFHYHHAADVFGVGQEKRTLKYALAGWGMSWVENCCGLTTGCIKPWFFLSCGPGGRGGQGWAGVRANLFFCHHIRPSSGGNLRIKNGEILSSGSPPSFLAGKELVPDC